MKTIPLALSVLCVAPLLQSCATPPGSPLAWEITPFMSVRHGTEGQTAEAFYQLGKYYQGKGRYEFAIEAYKDALKADSHYVEAYSGLGTVYAAQGHFEQAEETFNSAIVIAPKMAHLHNNLGYAYFLQGKYSQAIVAFETAAKLDATNLRTWNNLGMALARNGDQIRSNQAFVHALELESPSAPANVSAVQERQNAVVALVQTPAQELTPASQPTVLAVPKDRGVIAPLPAAVAKTEVAVAAPEMNSTPSSSPAPVATGLFAIQETTPTEEAASPVESQLPNQPQSLTVPVAESSGYSIKIIPEVELTQIELRQLAPQVFELRPSTTAPSLAQQPTADLPNLPTPSGEVQQLAQTTPTNQSTDHPRPVIAKHHQHLVKASHKSSKVEVVHQVVEPRIPYMPTKSLEIARDPSKPLASPLASMSTLQSAGQSVYRRLRYFRLELANGIGVKGLAKRMSTLLIAKGAPKSVLSDQRPFRQMRTEIQYREGFASVAIALSRRMSTHPAIVKVTQSNSKADVRIVLGKDIARHFAQVEGVDSEFKVSDATLLSIFEGLFIKS